MALVTVTALSAALAPALADLNAALPVSNTLVRNSYLGYIKYYREKQKKLTSLKDILYF
jgi:hypothetical protein